MAVKLLNTLKRVAKNERGAYVWKVGNGYKMSRKAKILLGIDPEGSGKLGIGFDEDLDSLVIKHDSTEGEFNCSVSKLNIISNTGIVEVLASYGDRFEISNDVVEGNFRIMKSVSETVTTNEEEVEVSPMTLDEVTSESEEDDFL